MQAKGTRRRAFGTGEIWIENGAYMGRWRTLDGKRPKRKLGPVRKRGTSEGMTRRQAEDRLRELMGEPVVSGSRTSVEAMGSRLVSRLEAKGRAKSSIETAASHVRVHLAPHFGSTSIERIDEAEIERFVVALRRAGKAPKTIRNVLSTLHSIFDLALRAK